MRKRPLSVTILSLILLATGIVGLVFHLTDFKAEKAFPYDTALVSSISLLAILSGAYMLRGRDWARWLALAWIACHVVISMFHSWQQVVVHSLLLVVFAYFLIRADANQYFRGEASASS